MDYIIRLCDVLKKEMFDSLYKHFFGVKMMGFPFLDIKFLKKENFDGLCNYFLDNEFVQFPFWEN